MIHAQASLIDYDHPYHSTYTNKGIVVSQNYLSSDIGVEILDQGGNAVDAAIAASAVQSVVCPSATGIGGDCFAIISFNGKNPISVNGSGIAPKKANLEYFIDRKSVKNKPEKHCWYFLQPVWLDLQKK